MLRLTRERPRDFTRGSVSFAYGCSAAPPIRVRQGSAWELFKLSTDISEDKDLSKENPQLLDEMVMEWEKLDEQMVEAAFR